MTWTYEPTETIQRCNLCGSAPDQWTTIAHRDRAGFPATAVACRACGLVFLTPRMSAASYGRFYASGAYRATSELVHRRPHDVAQMQRSQAYYADCLCRWLTGKLDCGGNRLLDIGGSNGIVAAAVRDCFGFERATVLDPAVDELAEAADRGLTDEVGSFESWEPDGRTWDLILLAQTVDHLLDIAGSLAKVRRLLAPGGMFVVDAVNFPWLVKAFGCVEKAVKIDHPHNLSGNVMAAFLLRAGFKIVHFGNALGGRKAFFLCRAGEVRNAMPDPAGVAKFFGLIEEVGKCGSP